MGGSEESVRKDIKMLKFIHLKEYVSLLIGLYKNDGSVSCVVIYFFFLRPVYLTRTQLVEARFTQNKKEYLSLLNFEKYIILL